RKLFEEEYLRPAAPALDAPAFAPPGAAATVHIDGHADGDGPERARAVAELRAVLRRGGVRLRAVHHLDGTARAHGRIVVYARCELDDAVVWGVGAADRSEERRVGKARGWRRAAGQSPTGPWARLRAAAGGGWTGAGPG